MNTFLGFAMIIALVVVVVGIVLLIVAYATKQKIKAPLVVMLVGVVIGVLSIGAVAAYSAHAEKVRQEEIAEAKIVRKQMDKKFNKSYSSLKLDAYSAATTAEDLGNKVQSAWNDAIFEDSGATVAGKKYTDFNKAVSAVFDDQSDKLSTISDAEDSMNSDIKSMAKNQTKNTKNKLSKAQKIVKAVKKLDRIVTNPTGNISDFSSSFSEADTAVADVVSE